MFDLFRSRDKAVRILLGAILLVVAVSMVTYLIPGAGGSSVGGGDENVIARVGDDKLTTQYALTSISNTMRGRQLPPEMMSYFAPQVVQGLITERALGYEAKRLGMQVSDEDISNAVKAQVPPTFYKKDGSLDQDMLGSALSQQNYTIPQFIEDIRRQLLISRLRTLVTDGVVVTKADVQQEYRKRNDKVKVAYVLVKPTLVEPLVQVTPADVQAYFDKNKQTYVTPEKKSMAIIFLDSAKVQQSINPTDSQLQQLYNTNLDSFRSPERVKIRHILLKTDALKNDDAQVQAKAADLLKQIKGGADFAELAKKFSQDPGSAQKGGDLDYVTRGQMVKPFEDAAFSLKTGETSGLVKTTYGYHILQAQDRQEARVKPLAEVRDTLVAEYKKNHSNELMQKLADQARAALKKDPEHPDKAASDVGGNLVRVENVKAGDPLPQIGVNQAFQTALAGLKKGDVTTAVSTTPVQLAVALITAATPAHPASLDEVRAQVESAVRRQKVDDLVQQKVKDLAAKAKADGNDLAKAAKEMDLELKTSNDVDRQGAVEGFGSASILSDAFTSKENTIIGPLSAADGKAVVKVLSHTPADMSKLAPQETTLRDELKAKVSRERLGLFEDGVRKKLEAEGKVKVQQDALNRLLQGMKG